MWKQKRNYWKFASLQYSCYLASSLNKRSERIFLSCRDGACPVSTSCTIYIYLLDNLNNSPIHKTREEDPIIIAQSLKDKGITLNISPPKVTIRYWPIKISNATSKKLLLSFKLAKAERPSIKAFALNIFQNCSITKKLKNHDKSCGVKPSCAWK